MLCLNIVNIFILSLFFTFSIVSMLQADGKRLVVRSKVFFHSLSQPFLNFLMISLYSYSLFVLFLHQKLFHWIPSFILHNYLPYFFSFFLVYFLISFPSLLESTVKAPHIKTNFSHLIPTFDLSKIFGQFCDQFFHDFFFANLIFRSFYYIVALPTFLSCNRSLILLLFHISILLFTLPSFLLSYLPSCYPYLSSLLSLLLVY